MSSLLSLLTERAVAMSRTEEQKAARRKAAQDRRAAKRQALIDKELEYREEMTLMDAEWSKTHKRYRSPSLEIGAESLEEVQHRVQEILRLRKEARTTEPD